jgi:hypothetical protein
VEKEDGLDENLSADIQQNKKKDPGLEIAADTITKFLKQFLNIDPADERPVLVLSIDEAHFLTSDPHRHGWTAFTAFRRVLHRIRNEGLVFTLFLSTAGKIGEYSPPQRLDKSARVNKGTYHSLPPFFDLDFDQFADKIVPSDGFSLEKFTTTEEIIKFGRPL